MGAKNAMEYMKIRQSLVDLLVTTGGGIPQRIPPSRKLAETFGCTHPTVLRALRDLVAEGLLTSCKRGGYIAVSKPEVMRSGMKIFGIVVQNGKEDFDTIFFEKQYHAVASDLLERSLSYCIHYIYLETPSRLGTVVTQNNLSGLILIAPPSSVLQEAEKERKKGLPVVAFYQRVDGMNSCDLGAYKTYTKALHVLYAEGRRKWFIVGSDKYYYLSEVERAVADFLSEHADVSITFLKEDQESNAKEVSVLLERGEIFDGVLFLLYDRVVYDLFRSRFDMKNKCRFIIDQFAVFRDMQFTGWMILFDLASAALWLNDQLFIQNTKYSCFEFDEKFCFYQNGICTGREYKTL